MAEREPQLGDTGGENRIIKKIEWEGGEAVVRCASQEDLDGYLAVVADKRRVWKEEGKKEDITPIDDKEIEFRKKIIESAQNGKMVFLVVEADGMVCGYIDIRRNTDAAVDITKPTAFQKVESPDYDKATVMDVTVRSDYRDKHFGRELVGAGVEEAKSVLGVKTIELETDEDNHSAQKAYERCGFRLRGFVLTADGEFETKKRADKTVRRIAFEKKL